MDNEVSELKKVIENNRLINPVVHQYLTKFIDNKVQNKNNGEQYQDDEEIKIKQALESETQNKVNEIIITSGYNIEGYCITKYIDYIMKETVLGVGLFKSIAASLSNITGTESNALSEKIDKAKNDTMYVLKREAVKIGANAIIGVDIDLTMFGDSMIAVIANGTAVVIEKTKENDYV